MPLTKEDTLHFKGVAILGMVFLHLFCRLGNLPYTPLIWIGDVPIIYYLGLFGDMCVAIYCFCSGYAHYLIKSKNPDQYNRKIPKKILKFLVNYWIVVIIFSGLGLLFDSTGDIPGSLSEFAGNMFVVGMSYNGAWWFVTTYLLLLVLSPVLFHIANRVPGILLVLISGVVYTVSHVIRFSVHFETNNVILNWLYNQLVLFGTSQFPYFLGMVVYRYRVPEKVRTYFRDGRHHFMRFGVVVALPFLALIGHGIVQSAIVAPVTAMIMITSLTVAHLPAWVSAVLSFLGKHSTNIWLTHMFFYLTLFKGLVFHAQYPMLIAAFMFVLCIGSSYLINLIYKPICKKIG